MDSQQKDPDLDRLIKVVDGLYEHFDTVHIFTTRHEGGENGGTIRCQKGKGNWYARYGQIRCWLVQEDKSLCNEVKREDEE